VGSVSGWFSVFSASFSAAGSSDASLLPHPVTSEKESASIPIKIQRRFFILIPPVPYIFFRCIKRPAGLFLHPVIYILSLLPVFLNLLLCKNKPASLHLQEMQVRRLVSSIIFYTIFFRAGIFLSTHVTSQEISSTPST